MPSSSRGCPSSRSSVHLSHGSISRDGGRSLAATAGGRAYRIALPRGPAVQIGSAAPQPATVAGPGGATAAAKGSLVTIARPDGTQILLVGHRADVNSVAFSADGTRVVTASADHDARIWDARSGALLQVLLGHFATVSDARFSPDGRWVVTAGPETAGLWSATKRQVDLPSPRARGQAPVGRLLPRRPPDRNGRGRRQRAALSVHDLRRHRRARRPGERTARERTGRVPTDAERQRYGP